MDPARPRSNLYRRPEIESITSKPTLPSLRSQVGEYLPQSNSRASISGFNNVYHLQGAPPPIETASSARISTSSSLLSPSALSGRESPSASRERSNATAVSNYQGIHSRNSNFPSGTSNASGSDRRSLGTIPAAPLQVSATRSTVSVACTNCRSAHLACSDVRPCRRCVQTGRSASCIDVEPRKRGRPRASDLTPVTMTTSMMQNLSTETQRLTTGPAFEADELVIIMSTSLRCARLTAGVPRFLGHSPKAMLEQPLSTFIHPDEKQDYARFSLGLLSYPGVASRPVPVSATRLHQTGISELTSSLSGAPIHRRNFRLRTASNAWPQLKFEAYLGSAFGAHPNDPESLQYTYVVLKMHPLASFTSGRVELPCSSSNSTSGRNLTTQSRNGSGSKHYAPEVGVGGELRSGPSRATSQNHILPEEVEQSRNQYFYHSYESLRQIPRSGQ